MLRQRIDYESIKTVVYLSEAGYSTSITSFANIIHDASFAFAYKKVNIKV